ncbi:FadR/GntR family transcriptional regulator [Mycolicibacterium vaccae]|uniref:FadR/GntR family transcriptional regulator n=1 Tax=Mycolicibacterium vaccae TaxID=1810 RepID=UPI003CF337E8
MPLTTARRSGLVDQVIEQLRMSVGNGEWAVGQRIPNEAELAQSLGVGRNTVREAVRALAHAGILDVRQGDGTYVRATSEVSGALRRLCGSELRDVLQVRRALEVEGARAAAARRTADDVAHLRSLLAHRDACLAAGDTDEFARADAQFHLAIVTASHNPTLTELYRGLMEAITASVASGHDSPARVVDHGVLLEHIVDGDVDAAAATAAELIDVLLAELPQPS